MDFAEAMSARACVHGLYAQGNSMKPTQHRPLLLNNNPHQQILAAASGTSVVVWNTETGERVAELPHGDIVQVRCHGYRNLSYILSHIYHKVSLGPPPPLSLPSSPPRAQTPVIPHTIFCTFAEE